MNSDGFKSNSSDRQPRALNVPTSFSLPRQPRLLLPPAATAILSLRDECRRHESTNLTNHHRVTHAGFLPTATRLLSSLSATAKRGLCDECGRLESNSPNQNPASDAQPSWGAQADSDGDGIGDACDTNDDDNDGVNNDAETARRAQPRSAKATVTHGDACDDMTTTTACFDANDAFPFDPNESVDTDGDGHRATTPTPTMMVDAQSDVDEVACGFRSAQPGQRGDRHGRRQSTQLR